MGGTIARCPRQIPGANLGQGSKATEEKLLQGRGSEHGGPLSGTQLPHLHTKWLHQVVLGLPCKHPVLPALGGWEGLPGNGPAEARARLKDAGPWTEAGAGSWALQWVGRRGEEGRAQAGAPAGPPRAGLLQPRCSPWPRARLWSSCLPAGPWARPHCDTRADGRPTSRCCWLVLNISWCWTPVSVSSLPAAPDSARSQTAWLPPAGVRACAALLLQDAAGAAGRAPGLQGAEVRADGEGAGSMEPAGPALSSSQASRTQGALSTNRQPASSAGPRSQLPAHPPSPHPAPRAGSPAQGPSHLLGGDPQPVHGKLVSVSHNSPGRVPLTPMRVSWLGPSSPTPVLGRAPSEMHQRVGSYQTLNVRMRGARPSPLTQLEKLRPTGCRALAIFLRSLQAGGGEERAEHGLTPSLHHQGSSARLSRDPEPVARPCPEEPPTEIPRAQDPRPLAGCARVRRRACNGLNPDPRSYVGVLSPRTSGGDLI